MNVVCLYTASKEALDVIRSVNNHHIHNDHNLNDNNKSTKSINNDNSNLSYLSKLKSKIHRNKPWANCLYRFYSDNTKNFEYRNNKIKLFPKVVEASWAIQLAVGKNPALICYIILYLILLIIIIIISIIIYIKMIFKIT